MGRFVYGPQADAVEIDDRTLAHLEIVTLAKLRRNEPFALSLPHGPGRRTVWVNSASILAFEFDVANPGEINRAWLDALIDSANTAPGLKLVPEPAAS